MSDLPSYAFAFVLLLLVLIFVHELGHFLVAKACGVRVLKFSLGFGPPIGFGRWRLAWRRGDTDYVVAWFPLGGFVKMLGENPDEQDDPELHAHPSEALGAKPLWQKLAIVFAGPVMNLLLPVVVFVGMQAVGTLRADAVIGTVETGSPAAAADLRPGDRIVEIAGQPVRWWHDLAVVLRDSHGEQVTLRYQRGEAGGAARLAVATRSGFDEFGQVRDEGWIGIGHARPRAVLGVPAATAPAQRAGLRSGDVVTAVSGEPIEDWYGFLAAYAAAGSSGTVRIDVERKATTEDESLSFDVPALGDAAALGVLRANVLVSVVEAGAPADRAGIESGDLIVEFDGQPVTSFFSFAQAVSTSAGRPIALVIARQGALHELSIAPELIPTDMGFGMKEPRYRIGIGGFDATLPGRVAIDQQRNPLVSLPGAIGMTVDVTRVFMVGLGKIVTGEISRKQVAGPLGIAEIAGDAFQRGWEAYLRIMVLISINLGILNLLPIPVLDGGQAMVFLVEGIKRSPLSLRTRLAVQQLGLTMLVLLMGLAFWNDLSRLWSRVVEWLPSGL